MKGIGGVGPCNVTVDLLVTMELTFLFICFYLYICWQLESSGYSSLGLLSAVRRSYTTYSSNLLFCKHRDLEQRDLDLDLATTKYIGE